MSEQQYGNVGIPVNVWWEGGIKEDIVIYVHPDRLCVASALSQQTVALTVT